jgi:cell wall-associated NlpC family hydrolase
MGVSKTVATLLSLAALVAPTTAFAATNTGGVAAPASGSGSADGSTGGAQYSPPVSAPPPSGAPRPARLVAGVAHAPAGAPRAVVRAIRAGNKLQNKPYLYGGGHRAFKDTAYDCSGAVSFALHGAGLLKAPLNSSALMKWGVAGAGSWITVYGNAGHAYAVIAGLRLDTSGSGGRGPRWQLDRRDPAGFVARHPAGL